MPRGPATTNHFATAVARLPASSRFDSMPMISITALAGVSPLVRNAYGERLRQRAGRDAMLDIEAIETKDCLIPHVTLADFTGSVARLAGEEHFGLMLAPHHSIASCGCRGDPLLATTTLGGAVAAIGERADHAHHRRDADQDMHVGRTVGGSLSLP